MMYETKITFFYCYKILYKLLIIMIIIIINIIIIIIILFNFKNMYIIYRIFEVRIRDYAIIIRRGGGGG